MAIDEYGVMNTRDIEEVVFELTNWASNFDARRLSMAVRDPKDDEQGGYDYVVDKVVEMKPSRLVALPVWVSVSADSIGVRIGEWSSLAELTKYRANPQSSRTIAGTEPLTSLSCSDAIGLLELVAAARLPIEIAIVANRVVGAYMSTQLAGGANLSSAIGFPRRLVRGLAALRLASIESLPYASW